MNRKIQFTVYGKPEPAGSKKAFPFMRQGRMSVAVVDANKNAKPWKQLVAAEAVKHHKGELLTGPLNVCFQFYVPRPAGHFGKKGLKPSAPPFPVVRPDVLKLARGVEDALTGVIWRDDSQIVLESLVKNYGNQACVIITICEITLADFEQAAS